MTDIKLTTDILISLGFHRNYNKYSDEYYFTHANMGLHLVEHNDSYVPAILYDSIQFIRKGINIDSLEKLKILYNALTGLQLKQFTEI